jgi:hypothetical protein
MPARARPAPRTAAVGRGMIPVTKKIFKINFYYLNIFF